MSDLDEKVDKLEAAVDPNTVISIGGYSFTPAKLMIAGGIVSTVLGGLYGAFEFYRLYGYEAANSRIRCSRPISH